MAPSSTQIIRSSESTRRLGTGAPPVIEAAVAASGLKRSEIAGGDLQAGDVVVTEAALLEGARHGS